MAELFLARAVGPQGNGRHVVLKRIARERASDTQFVQMFLDEARLAAQLRHPNIAQVFDIGRLGASYYFTMEYVHGVTVEDLIERVAERRTVIPVEAVLSIMFGTAAGLSHAHERTGNDGKPLGIVHRDISPSNLMVGYDGHVKVVDFGVAKARMAGRQETQAGEIKGKVGYLSPEQCRLAKLDGRSDLYSLGVVGWEMLTGKRLWKRETAFSTMAAIATEEVPLASEYRERLWPEVDALIAKLLSTEVKERYQDARELIQAIELVATTTRSNTSPSQLSLLMRELFGSPPEPWKAERRPISVRATPVPSDLELSDDLVGETIDTIEHKLTTVFSAASLLPYTGEGVTTSDLSVDRLSTASIERPLGRLDTRASTEVIADAPSTEVLDAPSAPIEATMIGAGLPLLAAPTVVDALPLPAPTVVDAPAYPSAPPRPSFGRMPPAGDPTVPLGTQLPPVLPPVAPFVPGPPLLPEPSTPNVPRWPPPAHGDLRRLRWWVLGGILLGLSLVVLVLVLRGDDRAVALSPDSVVIVATTPDASSPLQSPPDGPPDGPPDAPPEDAAVDAMIAQPPPDAPPVEAVKPRRSKLRTKPELNAAFRERRYEDIVAACTELGADGERAVVCTLAACRAHALEAQAWYRNVPPKQRDGAIRMCKQAGHSIEDTCAKDPTSCRK